LAAAILLAAVLAAYLNSLRCPLVFDDVQSITDNASIRQLRSIGSVLSPPPGTTVSGRPLLNLTLAINYAIGGLNVLGYRVTNVAIHLLGALTLMGIVRRTLVGPRLRGRYGAAALPLALAIALIWALHPLQTESVTYLIQRAESLAGLFYVLTLYGVIRGSTGRHGAGWNLLAVVCCLLGAASKEVVVTAPLMVLVYDRTFLAGSFREAWRRRWALYVGLALSWLLTAYLFAHTANRGGAAGLGIGVSPWHYLLTQARAIARYLQLTLWPARLTLDYGTWLAPSLGAIWPMALLVVVLLTLTGVALWRWPGAGLLGLWFFAVLAPTSSFVPVGTQTVAEHRIYLALAAPVALAVLGFWTLCRPLFPGAPRAGAGSPSMVGLAPPALLALVAAALALATARRNEDYQSALSIWRDTTRKCPDNERAHVSLGIALAAAGDAEGATAQYRAAVHIRPDYALGQYNLGIALLNKGQVAQAANHLQKALTLEADRPGALPDAAEAHDNYGVALARAGRIDEAIAQFEGALQLRPAYGDAQVDLGNALREIGQIGPAIAHYEKALEVQPANARAHIGLGNCRLRLGQTDQAITQFRQALELNPGDAETHYDLGAILAGRGRIDDAMAHFQKALEIRPDFAKAHYNLGVALAGTGHIDQAVAQFQQAIAVKPDYAQAHYSLGAVLAACDRLDEAISHFRQALAIKPDFAEAHNALGLALAQRGQFDQAIAHFQKALEIRPDYGEARRNLQAAGQQR
jgi:tetratricopeptide (TPR) repeat protein